MNLTTNKLKTYLKNNIKMKIIQNIKVKNNVNKGLTSVVFLQHVHRDRGHGSFPEVERIAVREVQNLAEFLGQKGMSAGVKTRFLMCIVFVGRIIEINK
jgi:hypothetical protein